LPLALPNLQIPAPFPVSKVLSHLGNELENPPIPGTAQQLDIFRVRPHQRHRRSSGFTQAHIHLGPVRPIPYLFGQHAGAGSELLHSSDERPNIPSGGEFVVAAFSGEERPGPATTPTDIGFAIVALPVTVVVVAPPAGPIRCFYF